jgi:hypothetical protein
MSRLRTESSASGATVCATIGPAVCTPIGSAVCSTVCSTVSSAIGAAVCSTVATSEGSTVGAAVSSAITDTGDALRAAVRWALEILDTLVGTLC